MFKRFFKADHSFLMKRHEEDLWCLHFCGYRLIKDCDHKGRFYWAFAVTGFEYAGAGKASFCRVLRSNGSEAKVPIDREGRILINGQRYGRNDWIYDHTPY